MDDIKVRPLTSRTRVALAIARGVAASRGDRDLTPCHVAIGICREGANPALAALWYAGMSEQQIRQLPYDLEASFGEAPGHMPPRLVAIELSPGEESMLRLSDVEAHHLGDPFLGTEHILLAILRSDPGVAQKVGAHGVTAEKYYDGLLSMRRGDPSPGEPRAI